MVLWVASACLACVHASKGSTFAVLQQECVFDEDELKRIERARGNENWDRVSCNMYMYLEWLLVVFGSVSVVSPLFIHWQWQWRECVCVCLQ